MNVLDIDRQTFEGSCYRASQSLMWNARQQTDPEKMLRFALAARYAEGYVERVIDMHRNKALASFELGLMNSERFELSGIPDNDALTPDLISRLTAFIEDSAKLHAGRDLDEGRIDHESPNFGAMAVSCAENTAGIDDFVAGKRVGELLASRDKGTAGNEAHDVLTVEYEASYGERYRLALYRDTYANGGGLAVAALDVTDKDSEEYMEPWGALTVNIPDDPRAAEWCSKRGNVVIDTNNNSKELVDALVGAGIVTLTGGSCRSGFCVYPLASVAPSMLEAMGTYAETAERLTDDRREEPQQDATRDDGRGYSLASIEREVRSVPERDRGDVPDTPDAVR